MIPHILHGSLRANPIRRWYFLDLIVPRPPLHLIWGYPNYLAACAPDHCRTPKFDGIASMRYGCLTCLVPGHLLNGVVLVSEYAFRLRFDLIGLLSGDGPPYLALLAT